MRTLAIDLGTRRVGLALSDEGGRFATPFDIVQVTDPKQALAPITQLVNKEGVQRIVLGLPLNMDDTLGPAAKSVLSWGKLLTEQTGLAITFVDERLSSFEAEQSLIDQKRQGKKITRDQKKRQLDALAAAMFLQAFLDGKLPALEMGPV